MVQRHCLNVKNYGSQPHGHAINLGDTEGYGAGVLLGQDVERTLNNKKEKNYVFSL